MSQVKVVSLEGIHVKTVSVEYHRKMNLGDYNSADFGCTMWADLDEESDPTDACRTLGLLVKENVRNQAMNVMAVWRKELEAVIEKLPVEQQRAFQALVLDTNLEVLVGLPLQLGAAEALADMPYAGPSEDIPL